MRIVLDTNILLVSISPKSKYYWIFEQFLNEKYTLCVTTDILSEYEEIISQYMSAEVANEVLQIIENARNVAFITKYYRWNLINNDPDDNKFVDCAISCNARYLVTQDKHFNVLKKVGFPKIEVINIQQFKQLQQ